MAPLTVLSLEAVGKRYGATRALDDVSLNFAEGRITAVIGRSGSGVALNNSWRNYYSLPTCRLIS
jgi:ABC-type branched-subunit amino acid transport system ATPase component